MEGGTSQVETETATLSNLKTARDFAQLPLSVFGRGWANITNVTAGIQSTSGFEVNGARDTANNFTADGISVNEMISSGNTANGFSGDIETFQDIKILTAALLGGTIESMQVWDIQRSADYLIEHEKLSLSGISILGRKQMGALALHAAALDGRITRVILEDVPPSHWQEPPLLNVLRVTDLPEIAGMMAPREILSLTPLPESFRYTSSICRLHGKAIREASALGEALQVWEHE